MNRLFELAHETRQHVTRHADGSETLVTMRLYEDGTQIAYAQEADENLNPINDVYDIEWDNDLWDNSDVVHPRR